MRTVLIAIAAGLLAQSAWSAEVGPERRAQARQQFEQGEREYKLGRFDSALAAYSKAYEYMPMPAFLFNIGQCHRKLGNHERALFFFQGYLREQPKAKNRPVVEELIAECQRKLGETQEEARRQEEQQKQERKLALERDTAEAQAKAEAARRAAEEARAQAAVAEATRRAPVPEAPPTPVYKTWWFWTAIGLAVTAAASGTAIALTREGDPILPSGSLGTVDWRQ